MTIKWIQVLILTGVFLIQYLLEHKFPQDKKINNWINERFNIGVGFFNLAVNFFPATILVLLLGFIDRNNLGLLQQWTLPLGVELLLTILVLDLWMYAWHWFNHNTDFLWQFHRFHHRDEKMNSTTALRFHFAELLFSLPGKAVVYTIFGLSFLPVMIYEILFFSSVVIHHSNIFITEKLDALYRLVFASPRMHRIHHSRLKVERNSNYGSLFSFWDKIFGSFRSQPKGEIIFGTDD
jgi:sterol desaturase/sphingolipid hydroxylase (fatty acid hydroxylase superfamily)